MRKNCKVVIGALIFIIIVQFAILLILLSNEKNITNKNELFSRIIYTRHTDNLSQTLGYLVEELESKDMEIEENLIILEKSLNKSLVYLDVMITLGYDLAEYQTLINYYDYQIGQMLVKIKENKQIDRNEFEILLDDLVMISEWLEKNKNQYNQVNDALFSEDIYDKLENPYKYK